MTVNIFCCYSSQRCTAAPNTTPATSRKLFCLLYSHGTGSEKGFAPTIVSGSGSLKQKDRVSVSRLWQPDWWSRFFLTCSVAHYAYKIYLTISKSKRPSKRNYHHHCPHTFAASAPNFGFGFSAVLQHTRKVSSILKCLRRQGVVFWCASVLEWLKLKYGWLCFTL
jgi:hypothetical protein